jgi:hypothetical protein
MPDEAAPRSHSYMLTFAAGQPSSERVLVRDDVRGTDPLLIENPIHRCLINSPMPPTLKKEQGWFTDDVNPEGLPPARI